jgi:predicted amidohydrolase
MEDPICFDVYGHVVPELVVAAADALVSCGAYPTKLAARSAAARARHSGLPVLLASRVGWGGAQALRTHGGAFRDILVLQAGYAPGDNTKYCPFHDIHFAGIFGCHICNGFYVR